MLELLKLGLCNKFFAGSTLHIVIGFSAVLIIGYLLGSLNFGVIISKVFYRDDIRKHGSGNAGMTNMLRTYGKIPAAATFLGDGLKTALAVFTGALFLGVYSVVFYTYEGVIYPSNNDIIRKLYEIYGEVIPGPAYWTEMGIESYNGFAGIYIGGLAGIIGHAFPVYYKFKGGKGVVATFVMVLCTEPFVALICLMFFAAVVWGTKFISAGSVMAVIVYPLILNRMTGSGLHNIIAIFVMLFVVYLHRGNIIRLMNGKENKLELNLKRKKKDDGD